MSYGVELDLENRDDGQLWQLFRDGGVVKAFEFLHSRHADALRSWLRFKVGLGAEDAADVAQDAWMRAYRNRHSFKPGKAAFSTWLHTIAKRLAYSLHNKRRRHGEEPLERAGEDGETYVLPEAQEQTNGLSPADIAVQNELRERTKEAVGHLSPSQKDATRMRIVEGATYEEIAAELDAPMGTVKSRICRGRRRLTKLLFGSEDE
jgi:RNA polymerase sigma-70 factor (ECF subfamily)